MLAFARRVGPWLIGAAILAAIAARFPLSAFRAALGQGAHLPLAVANIVITALVLTSDSIATWIALLAARMRRPLGSVLVVRGATYLLLLVNYALGQGGFGYYLYRTGVPALRATGATLFIMGTNFATLLLVTTAAWAFRGIDATSAALWWTLTIGCAALGVYLIVIAIAPAFLARRELLAPLFAAGLRGHALAIAGRIPHVAVIVLGYWGAMRVWGIDVPFAVGVTLMPAVVIAAALPIAPGGLGTTQAAAVYFFSSYAAGATADERGAALLAFAIVHFVYGVSAAMAFGLICAPLARRDARRAEPEAELAPERAT
jgi:hypothetical protein